MRSIFDYIDYRELLRDFYKDQKVKDPKFTHRHLAQLVGFRSSGFFSQILQAKSNISNGMVLSFAKVMNLKPRETEYFQLMVQFNQAKTHKEKKHCFEKMLSFKEAKIRTLHAEEYEYFDKWYYVAVRELLNFYPFCGDCKALAKMVRPNITSGEAQKAIELLERLGLIQKDLKGRYDLTDRVVTTGTEAQSVAVRSFQMNMLDLSKQAIERFSREERSVSTLTLSISPAIYKQIEKRIAKTRQEILDLVDKDPGPATRVYQYNFQIFPLTDPFEEQSSK